MLIAQLTNLIINVNQSSAIFLQPKYEVKSRVKIVLSIKQKKIEGKRNNEQMDKQKTKNKMVEFISILSTHCPQKLYLNIKSRMLKVNDSRNHANANHKKAEVLCYYGTKCTRTRNLPEINGDVL